MAPRHRRNLFLTRALVIGVSVLLFACGARNPEPPQLDEATLAGSIKPQAAPGPAVAVEQPVAVAESTRAEPVTSAEPAPPVQPEPSAEPASQEQAAPASRPVAHGPGHAFTNKDLERYRETKRQFGFRDDVVTVDLTQKADAPEKEGAGLTEEQRNKEADEIRTEINALTADLDYLKKRVPSLHNPYLPRVTPTEADSAAEAGLGNDERLDRVKDRIAQDESRLSQLRRRLADLHNMAPASGPGQ